MTSPPADPRRFVGPGLEPVITGPRPGLTRDRRGRGRRGPMALPGPLSPSSVPRHRSPRDEFDALVGEIVRALEPHFARESEPVDIVVEEAPLLPLDWSEPVPVSVVADQVSPTQLVLYRLPLARSARSARRPDVADAVWEAVLDGLAQVWQVPPESLDPRSR
ncbi:MAG: metallopeptidase family protein [Aeromicrobium sp.]|uniref:metallopeptidase family protein n=1 Tax=Aeromicrobium sp. TaxID=1871063 RepID=UPI0039E3F69C